MRWTIRRLVLALALPLAVGGAFEMWLGPAPALVAVVLAALLVGWIAIGYTVREAAAQQRAAASGLQWLQALAQVSLSLSQGLDRNRLLRQITEAHYLRAIPEAVPAVHALDDAAGASGNKTAGFGNSAGRK